MGRVRFSPLPPPLWGSKAIWSLTEMWNIMIPTLDFLGVWFFSSEHPVTVVLEDKAYCSVACTTRELRWGFPIVCHPLGRWGRRRDLDVADVDVQVPTTHGAFLWAMVWLIRYLFPSGMQSWSVGFFHCPVSHPRLSVESPHVQYRGEWEVPAGFYTATLSFLSTSDVCLHVHLMPQRRLFNR